MSGRRDPEHWARSPADGESALGFFDMKGVVQALAEEHGTGGQGEALPFEGFEPPESNFWRLPNNWFDLAARFSSWAEHKVVEYILRHTWGYHEYGIAKLITMDEFMHGRKRRDVAAVQQLEAIRGEGSNQSDERLGSGVDQQRRARAERAAEDERTDAEAAEKDRDERRGRVDRVAEDQAEVLQPDDLIEERTDP